MIEVRARGRGRWLSQAMALTGVAWQRQSYLNLLYLLTALPLGLIYTVVLTICLILAMGLFVSGAGIPMLAGTVAAWWWLGGIERQLAIWWLGVDVPPMLHPYVPPRPERGWLPIVIWATWGVGRAYLMYALTWSSLGYLVMKLPLGLLAFVFLGGGIALTAGLLAFPAWYLATGPARFPLFDLAVAAVCTVAGAATGVGTLHAGNALAAIAGRVAQLMLGAGDAARRLAAAEAAAQREQAKAERAERSRRELIVNVGHELRTPATSIRGHVESLLLALDGATPPPPAELRRSLGIVYREADRLGTLIDELLTLARADAGELHLELRPVAAEAVIEEVHQTLAPLARRERQVTLIREVTQGLPPVIADRQRLMQVLLNLVRNAISFTPEGGIVAVTLERHDDTHLAITVADTGIGIEAHELERIFERFYRTDASRTRASGGFGLGLAIVRDLVQAMGGSVTAESVPGEGSRFRVILPAARQGTPRAAR